MVTNYDQNNHQIRFNY